MELGTGIVLLGISIIILGCVVATLEYRLNKLFSLHHRLVQRVVDLNVSVDNLESEREFL